jgi:glutathione S-transferase
MQDYKYRLIYFNARGSAEFVRYIFAYTGKEYKDLRFEKNEWPKYKPYTPFRNVPVLEISDGVRLVFC